MRRFVPARQAVWPPCLRALLSLLALLALLALLGLAPPAAAADPEVHVLGVADRAPGERRPLLVYLHGLGGSGAESCANPALRALAERGRMVLVAPDGNVDREGRRFWNAGGACCNLDGKAVNDVARLEALIAHWLERPEIDPARVYIIGFSNGGFMAHRLACFMDDRLAAVVSIGGAGRARDEACAPATPIAVAEVHGDADPIVRYQGGARPQRPRPRSPPLGARDLPRLGNPPRLRRRSPDDDRRPGSAPSGRRDDNRGLRRLPPRRHRALDRPRWRASDRHAGAPGPRGRVAGRPPQGAAKEEGRQEETPRARRRETSKLTISHGFSHSVRKILTP